MYPCEPSSPADTSSESPGRKNPISSPVSAKMITAMPVYPAACTSPETSRSRLNSSDKPCILWG